MRRKLDTAGTLLVLAGLALLCVSITALSGSLWWGVLTVALLIVAAGLVVCWVAAGGCKEGKENGGDG